MMFLSWRLLMTRSSTMACGSRLKTMVTQLKGTAVFVVMIMVTDVLTSRLPRPQLHPPTRRQPSPSGFRSPAHPWQESSRNWDNSSLSPLRLRLRELPLSRPWNTSLTNVPKESTPCSGKATGFAFPRPPSSSAAANVVPSLWLRSRFHSPVCPVDARELSGFMRRRLGVERFSPSWGIWRSPSLLRWRYLSRAHILHFECQIKFSLIHLVT